MGNNHLKKNKNKSNLKIKIKKSLKLKELNLLLKSKRMLKIIIIIIRFSALNHKMVSNKRRIMSKVSNKRKLKNRPPEMKKVKINKRASNNKNLSLWRENEDRIFKVKLNNLEGLLWCILFKIVNLNWVVNRKNFFALTNFILNTILC